MSESSEPLGPAMNKESLEKMIKELKAEIFDFIKEIDIANYAKQNKLQQLANLEQKLKKIIGDKT